MRRSRTVNVVGAGPGGLASAMLLAAEGFDVEVFEKRGHVGGRTSVMDLDGYRFDRGPTFFLYPQILEQVFARCGRSLHDEIELIRLDPNYRLVFEEGGVIDATSDVERMRAQLAEINPADAAALDGYLRANRDKLEAFRPILERPFLSHLDLLSLPLDQVLPLRRSVDDDLKRHFSDQRVRLGFSFQSKYLGMSPFRCPSLFTILAFLEYEHGVFHPAGGCGAVTEAMARVAREMGVRIHLNRPIRQVELEGRRAVGVWTDEGLHRADAHVINADFAGAMRDLVPDQARRRWTDTKLAKKKYSCSTFMLYLGLDGEEPALPHHTVYLSEGYAQQLENIERRYELSDNPSFYVQNPCTTDPSMAPAGQSALYVLVPVPHLHDNIDWTTARPWLREQTLDQLEHRLGVQDLRRRIRVERCFTPLDWATHMDLYRGATFSLKHSVDQMLSFRPRNRFEDLDGVYLAGGGTHPGSGLPVIFQSALITADLIKADLPATRPELPPLTTPAPLGGNA